MAHEEQILNKLLNKIAVEQKYESYDLKVTPILNNGASYTSKLFLATITSKNKDELNLFAKVAAAGEKLRAQDPFNLYETEQLIYTKLVKVYNELENQHGVPEEHRLVFPKLYGYSSTVLKEVLVLENLTSKGFTAYDRFNSVGWDNAAAAVDVLAKLHALSIAYQHEQPEDFEQLVEELKLDWSKDEGSTVEAIITVGRSAAMGVLKQEHEDKFNKFFDAMDSKSFTGYYAPWRHTVISHGDFKPSNLMHKVHDDGRVQVIPVDFQTMQGGSPVVDLLYFIFTGSDEQFRAQHYRRLLDHYHAQLSLALRRLHLDPDEKYSKEDFEYELKEKLPFGLAVAVFTLPVVTVEAEHAPKVNEDLDLSSFSIQNTSKLFPERLNGVVNDFVKWGILK